MKFPAEVDGWLTQEEGCALAKLARGKSVLEIGSYCGKSTICMAQTAERVFSIDPHDGRGTPRPRDTYADMLANLETYGVANKVEAFRGTISGNALEFATKFDLIFIDGAHDLFSVRNDIKHALSLLAPGGLIAFHDYRKFPGEYDGRWDEGVTQAVDGFLKQGAKLLGRHGSIAVVQPGEATQEEKPLVAIAMARRGPQLNDGAAEGFYRFPCRKAQVVALVKPVSTLLPLAFNQAWAGVLDLRDSGVPVRYFAMIHDDITPEPWWVDTLIDELERLQADVVSAVVPIKDEKGLTSTAVYTGDIWLPRRLSMAEVMELPETFGEEDAEGPLLLNTGLWVADITKPWADEVCFDFMNRIRRTSKGERVAECVPEDWLNSHRLNELGCKLYATRKVRVEHQGNSDYPNDRVWGSQATDQVYRQRNQKKEELQCV